MSTTFKDLLDAAATSVTMTAASLATSATAGRQSDAVAFEDGNHLVPQLVEVDLQFELTTGTLGGDGCVHLWIAESVDGTSYSGGNPAVGASDAAYTFTDSPVGSSAKPTPLRKVGSITFNAQSQKLRKRFLITMPPAKAVFVLLNNTNIAGSGSNFVLQWRARNGDAR